MSVSPLHLESRSSIAASRVMKSDEPARRLTADSPSSTSRGRSRLQLALASVGRAGLWKSKGSVGLGGGGANRSRQYSRCFEADSGVSQLRCHLTKSE